MTNEELEQLARKAAAAHNLDPALVCAICEQESGWNPWANRYEVAFFNKYVAQFYTNNKVNATEAYSRAFSYGLMQLMGQVARELGFANTYLTSLCDPATGVEWGCQHFAKKLEAAKGNVRDALLRWNGGGNAKYPDEVLARMPKYVRQNNHEFVQAAITGEL